MRGPEEWPSRPGSPGRTEFGLQVRLLYIFCYQSLPNSINERLLWPPCSRKAHLASHRQCIHTLTSASMTVCEVSMPQFVIEREIPGAGSLSDAELQAVARKSVGVLKEMGPEIKWLHSYVTGDKVYCVYLAPDEETVREHARRGGFPANRISAVRRMIDPNSAG